MSFRDYLLHGWKLCAIAPGAKAPKGKAAIGWQLRENAISDPAVGPTLAGAGLCHGWSGTCAIDIDNYTVAREWLAERGVDLDALLLAPDSVQISSGREGRAKLLYALANPLGTFKDAPYQKASPNTGKMQTFHAIEFRCVTAEGLTMQDVLPETMHPDTGRPYEWKYGDDLIGHWSHLPDLPEALREIWLKRIGPQTASSEPIAATGVEHSELRTLLSGQDPDASYDDWIRVGMALHHETQGSPDGLALWDEWSAKGSKYKGRQDLTGHWQSFRAGAAGAVTLGSLRAGIIAKPEDFPLVTADVAATEPDLDMRLDAVMQRIVGDKVVYVRESDLYFDLGDRRLYGSKDALRNDFLPQIPLMEVGDKMRKPDPVTWLMNSAERRSRDVTAIGMHPGEGAIYVENGHRFANGYRRPPPVEAVRPGPFQMEAFNFLWNRMEDPIFKSWLKKFYAHALKHPGVKIRSAPLLVSQANGTGKTILMATIPKLLFGRVIEMTEAQLRTQFNGELMNEWWVSFEEVYSGNTKAERRFVTEKVKTWLTNDDLSINAKNLTAFTMRNRLQFTASSNHLDALQLEDDEERRWGVCHVTEKPMTQAEVQDAVLGFLMHEKGPSWLKWIFQQESLVGFQKDGRPPITHAKKAMVKAGIGNWESTLVERMIGRQPPFDRDVFSLSDAHLYVVGKNGPISQHLLARMLRQKPFFCELLRPFSKSRLWAWRNIAFWQGVGERARELNRDNGDVPSGAGWKDEIPRAILEMGADSDAFDCADLLE